MSQPSRFALGSICCLLVASSPIGAQHSDVTFFVIGKHASYEQQGRSLEPVDFSFFAEIFLSAGGDASDAWLTLPTGERFAFEDRRRAEGGERDNIFYVAGKRRYAEFSELQADYPDGEYRIEFETPGGPVHARLNFTRDALPPAPVIALGQAGRRACSQVDPALDMQVGWSGFATGGPDPNDLLDDLIFVILTDDEGVRVAHSGRPFEDKPYLTYAAEGYSIPAGTMESGRTYTLSVEHAILDDTQLVEDVPAMTTRAVTTRMRLVAAQPGSDVNRDCEVGEEGHSSPKNG